VVMCVGPMLTGYQKFCSDIMDKSNSILSDKGHILNYSLTNVHGRGTEMDIPSG
jgi:hypothetical protein